MTYVAFSRPCFGVEEEQAVVEVLRSGWVAGGPRLVAFEQRFARFCGARYAVGVSSWTGGAFLVLKSLGIGPGDNVLVPSLTFIASVNVITHAGATPVFVDVDPATYNIDVDDARRKIGSRTKAIMPIDQLGMPCEIDRILTLAKQHNLLVLQDAACALGSLFRGDPVGRLSPVAVFSLHARKVVTTGEGGMIVTNDAEFAARLRRLRHQGMSLSDFERHHATATTFESYPEVGYNFRMTDIQAAIGICQLDRLDEMLAARKRVAERYTAILSNHPHLEPPFVPSHVTPNWQSYQVRVLAGNRLDRNGLMEALHVAGVATRRGVMASHLEPPYHAMNARLPATEAAAAECLQLPIHAGMREDDTERVLAVLQQTCGRG
jgi:perosamine synthetase